MNEPETPCIILTTRPVRALYIKSETRLVDVSSQALAARLEITYWKCLVYIYIGRRRAKYVLCR